MWYLSNNIGGVYLKTFLRDSSHLDDKTQREVLKNLCSQFESIFIYHLVEAMRKTVWKTELFHSDRCEGFYTSLLDMKLSEILAKEKGFGLATSLYKQLEKTALKHIKSKEKGSTFLKI